MNVIRMPQNRVSDAQAQRILEMIESGEYTEGDRLPGQRELSVMLNSSRSSIREAIRHLEALGILETRSGLGTYVISLAPRSATFFADWLQTHQDEVIKIFEVREALESKAAELAAVKATAREIEELKTIVFSMEHAAKINNLPELFACDIKFHNLIIQISQNELLYQIVHNIQDALKESRYAVLAMPERGLKSALEHSDICSAIEKHDPIQAKRTMIFHLQNAVGDVQF